MFWLCKVETSMNNLRHNDITKNQSESLKNYRSLSASGTIFNMAALGEDVVGRNVKVHEDIDELLSETLLSNCYQNTSAVFHRDQFIKIPRGIACEQGKITGRFETNTSSEIAQNFLLLRISFEQEKHFGWAFFFL